jgi:hypothetical protein
MPDRWYYTHAGTTHGPVSGVQLRGLIETDGIAPDGLIWSVGVAASQAVRADAALAFPAAAAVEPTDFQPAPPPPPPEWLHGLAEALAACGDVANLPPPSAQAWLPDVRDAKQKARQP